MDAVSLALGGVLGAGLASLVGRSREDRPAPVALADVLQWGFLVEGPERAVVLNKDGAVFAAWRYHGPDTAAAADAELAAIRRQVNDALLPLGDGWLWHVDAIRRPAEPYPATPFPAVSPEAPDVSVPAWIDAERRAAFAGGASAGPARGAPAARAQFVSEFTFTLTYLPPPTTQARAARLFVQRGDAVSARTSPAQAWHEVLTYFNGQVAAIEQRLGGRFHLARLDAAQLLSHLHECLTTLSHPVAPPPVGAYLNTVLASQEFVGGFIPRIGNRHLLLIAVEGYPDERPDGRPVRLDFLNTLAVPCRWSSRFIPLSQRTADKVLKQQRQAWFAKRRDLGAFVRELASSNKEQSDYKRQEEEELFGNQDARAMLKDVNAAMTENASGLVRFGFSTQVIVVAHEELATAERYAATITEKLHQEGFTTRRETVNAPEAFFGTLPAHGYPNIRRQPLHSANLADLWPLTSVWPGLAHNPSQYFAPASPPLMRVATDGSTPYRFNLHVGDVGHTLVIGGTGGGKSTLLGLVQAQWQRYAGAQTVVFDYDYSHWLLTKACGARHYDLCAGRADAVAFQPLADVDDPAERAWAGSWLEVFLTLQGVPVTPARRTIIARALALLGDQPRAHRTLSEFVIQVQDPELREAFRPYLAGGTYGSLFDAAEETVGEGTWQVYELKHLLSLNAQVVAPAFFYLAHRIERRLTGDPTVIVIEEVHAVIDRPEFGDLLRRWLLTLRKRNAAVVMVFHTPAQLEQLPAKQIVVESCPTRIFLPNPSAASDDNARLYRELGLNDAEIAAGVVKATPKRDYYVSTPLGARKISLELGPVASAFLGTPAGLSPQAMREEVSALAARVGDAWPAHWLARLRRAVPDGALVAAPAARPATDAAAGGPSPTAETTADVPLWREHASGGAAAGVEARRPVLAAPGAPAGESLAGATYLVEDRNADAWDDSAAHGRR